MPLRRIIPTLENLRLDNVSENMKRLWVKVYSMEAKLARNRDHDTITGPFSMLAGSLLQELLEIMRERRLLTPFILHNLLLPQLKSLNLNYCSSYVDNTLAHTITVRCKNLSSLTLCHCDQIPADTLVELVKALPCLTKLHLSSTQCNTQVLSAIRSFCPEINELDIISCKKLSADSLLHLVYDPVARSYCCQSLQRLRAEGLTPTTDLQSLLSVLVFVLLALPKLKYFFHNFVPKAVCLIYDQEFHGAQMPAGFPSLEEVARYRTSTHPNEGSGRFTLALRKIDWMLFSLLPKIGAVCPHLLEITMILRDSWDLDPHVLPWHNLTHVTFCSDERMDLKELLPVTANIGPQFKYLAVDGFIFKDELTLHTLLSHCPNLLKCMLFLPSPERNDRQSQQQNEARARNLCFPPLQFPELVSICLVYNDLGNPLPSLYKVVLGNIIESVFKYSPCLEILHLFCLPFSLDEAFQKALTPPSTALQSLRELELVRARISIHTINLLVFSENQLSLISLEKCFHISRVDYNELLQRVRKENLEVVITRE
uniref:F-box domain-containing protein n=1 Tax=Anolis carolinensis TaxID=28377 RepID=A0A803TCP8_ANOCA